MSDYKLYAHQIELLRRMEPGSFLIGAGCGTGKTLVGIEEAKRRLNSKIRTGRTLVVAPLHLLECAWAEDLQRFAPELRYANLWASTPAGRGRAAKASYNADICLINFESFKRMDKWLETQRFDTLIIDESSKMKSPKTDISKALLRFSRTVPRTFPMSGTPMPNGPLDLFFQVDAVKPGLLGSSYYSYRSRFFYPAGYMGHDWRLTAERRQDIMKLIAPYAMFLAKEDCLDLPSQTFLKRQFDLSAGQRRAYDTMVEDKILPLVDDRVAIANNVLSEIMKLRQITSGWLYDAERKAYEFSDSKLDVLMETLDEIGNNQVLVWGQFRHDIDKISEILGSKALKAYGGMGPEVIKQNVDAFKKGQVQYLIAHPLSLGHGHTMVNATYAVYYSLSYSAEEWDQSVNRIHRLGQTKPCTYFVLLARNTIDEPIYKAVRRKVNMSESAMEYLRTYKRGA